MNHLELFSVSPRYEPSVSSAHVGHWTLYQDDLRQAAVSLGHSFTILAAQRPSTDVAPPTDRRDLLRVLDVMDERTIADSVGASIEAGVIPNGAVVLLYEGSLGLLEALVPVARRHPSIRFVLNLFHHDRYLDLPRSGRDPRGKTSTFLRFQSGGLAALADRLSRIEVPLNMHLMAETDRRMMTARALGLPVRSTWALHSTLYSAPFPQAGEWSPRSDGVVRVLLPLSGWYASTAVITSVATTIGLVEQFRPDGVTYRWTLSGWFGDESRRAARIRRLQQLGVEVADRALDRDDYLRLFLGHDVTWLPIRGVYNAQSSGKALDALVAGRPLLSPSGSYGDIEQRRWLPGGLSYGEDREAAELLLAAPVVLPAMMRQLRERLSEIRRTYSPVTSIEAIDRLLEGPRDTIEVGSSRPATPVPEPRRRGARLARLRMAAGGLRARRIGR